MVNYDKLWKLLVDRKMSQAELRKALNIAPNTMTRMRMNEPVSLELLDRICGELDVDFGDIISYSRTRTVTKKDVTTLEKEMKAIQAVERETESDIGRTLDVGDMLPSVSVPTHFVSYRPSGKFIQKELSRLEVASPMCRKDLALLNEYLLMRGFESNGAPDYVRFCKEAEISPVVWSTYFHGMSRVPSKAALLKMAICLRMPKDSVLEFLSLAGAGYQPSNKLDLLVLALASGNYFGITDTYALKHFVFDLIEQLSERQAKAKQPPMTNLYSF